MVRTDTIAELIAPRLDAMGYELVRVRLQGGDRLVLQVMAERKDGGMSLDDCVEVSRGISAILDVADPIMGAYTLEVSSPGTDRPLMKPDDYKRFAGLEAKVEMQAPRDGRRRFRGRILGLDGDEVRLDMAGEQVVLPLREIQSAKLVPEAVPSKTARPARQKRSR